MGYYADGHGNISFSSKLTEEQEKEVRHILEYIFECWPHEENFNVSFDGKYYEEDVYDALVQVSNVAQIEDGEIEFSGEDYELWRFLWEDGIWIEQRGVIVYE